MRAIGNPKGWLVAPVLVGVAATSFAGYQLVSSGTGASTEVKGLSIKPAIQGGGGLTAVGGGNDGDANSEGTNAAGNGGGSATRNPAKAFTLSGEVTGLAPGVAASIPLRVRNPNGQAVRVETLTVTATGGTRTCPNSLVMLGSPATPGQGAVAVSLSLQGNAATTATTNPSFPVMLSSSAPDACQHFAWALTYAGTAVKG